MELIKMLDKRASKKSLIEKLNDLIYQVWKIEQKLKQAECGHLNLKFIETRSQSVYNSLTYCIECRDCGKTVERYTSREQYYKAKADYLESKAKEARELCVEREDQEG